MKASRTVLTAASGVATTWLTDQVMKRTSLPAAARPVVAMAAGAAVARVVQRIG